LIASKMADAIIEGRQGEQLSVESTAQEQVEETAQEETAVEA